MRDHDDSEAALVKLAANTHQAGATAGVEHCRSLVQNQNARVHGKNACNGHALLLTTGKRMGLLALETGKPHVGQRTRHALTQLGQLNAQVLGAERHIIFNQSRHQLIIRILENHAGRLTDEVRALGVGRAHSVHRHRSLVGQQKRVQMLRQRGLAAAVASQNADELACIHVSAHTRQSGRLAIVREPNVGQIDHVSDPSPGLFSG